MIDEAYNLMKIIDTIKEIFSFREIIRSVYKNKNVILGVSIFFILSFIVSYILIEFVPKFTYFGDLLFNNFKLQVKNLGFSKDMNNFEIVSIIWKNNLRVCLMNYIIGFFSLFVLLVNTYLLSYVLYKFGEKTFIYLILPHGVIEIPALILSVSAGILLYYGVIQFIINRNSYYLKESIKLLLFSIILFLIAGIVEGFVTYNIAKSFG
ncbi:stage II sporulation protein M [Methanocaldococcus indicus]|uniref:stage II sporulation protein M n=1 Tax=Methanocaldococcus indicus TaxID=213231 RepID=UPI003C6D2D29